MMQVSTGRRFSGAAHETATQSLARSRAAHIRSQRQAVRNIQDGMSMLQTAEDGMSEIQKLLDKLRERAVQASSGTLNDADREHVNVEFSQLVSQISLIADRTEWRGKDLLIGAKIDVGFLLDNSASMDGEIDAVADGVEAFEERMRSNNLNVSIGIVTMAEDAVDDTHMHKDIGSGDLDLDSITTANHQIDPFSTILNAAGAIDTVGTSEPDAFSWRDKSDRNMILVTDTGREADKIGADSFDETQADVAEQLNDIDVTLHAVRTDSANEVDDIVSATGGTTGKKGDSSGSKVIASMLDIAKHIADNSTRSSAVQLQVGADNNGSNRLTLSHPKDMTAFGLEIHRSNVATQEDALEALTAVTNALGTLSTARATTASEYNRLVSVLSNELNSVDSGDVAVQKITNASMALASSEMAKNKASTDVSLASFGQARNINLDFIKGIL
ncbi:MAG: hypothetical protein CMK59_12990 [Proteobacteria bacterium]|nr:hypothetical protein [Pseudomonadota bacterium]